MREILFDPTLLMSSAGNNHIASSAPCFRLASVDLAFLKSSGRSASRDAGDFRPLDGMLDPPVQGRISLPWMLVPPIRGDTIEGTWGDGGVVGGVVDILLDNFLLDLVF